MADNKNSREKQARDEENRQRQRELIEARERGDEPEPPTDVTVPEETESALDSVSYPATGADVVAAAGDQQVQARTGRYTVESLVPDADVEVFPSPAAVVERVQRPTVAATMKRVVEAADGLQGEGLRGSQRKAYEKTFLELRGIDADDDDEGLTAVSDWVCERIEEKGKLPGSREVRRQAATFCRSNGYEVGNDQWLGI